MCDVFSTDEDGMIAIINRGGPDDGVCTYSVGINNRILTTFEHDRRDGLATCLRKAADAVDRQTPTYESLVDFIARTRA